MPAPLELPPSVAQWTVEDVSSFLTYKGFSEAAADFQKHLITGKLLVQLTEGHLKDIGIREVGTRLLLLDMLQDLVSNGKPPDSENSTCEEVAAPGKVFNDPIHGLIKLHALLVKIIDTPQFQRLRNIKQLGGAYRVYPGASHNRFEHSIGVCHLAGVLAKTLQANQPELGITDKDIICVQAAGLCHDLGHGPFSHLFDGQFMPAVAPLKDWKHEDASIKMLDHLIEVNNLRDALADNGLGETDVIFIKELIKGPLEYAPQDASNEWPYKGRTREKGFLYEIVANKRTGIDVDRWDYFARDCHHLGMKNNFDHVRFIEFARVIYADEGWHISTRNKEAVNVLGMFLTRYTLYHTAYLHVTGMAIELMITEALKEANDHLLFRDSKGKMLRLSETMDDMEAFTQVADDVYYRILWSSDPNLVKAKEMLMRVERRQLFALVGQTTPVPGKQLSRASLDVATQIAQHQTNGNATFQADDLIVQVVSLGFGSNDDYPLKHVYFYSKVNTKEAVRIPKEHVSQILLPQSSQEEYIRVYCRQKDIAVVNAATSAFVKWCEKNLLKGSEPALASLQVSPLRPALRRTQNDSDNSRHPNKKARKQLNI